MIDVTKLHAGDIIKYSGVLFTARDQAHLKLHNMLVNNEKVSLNFENSMIYYAGPTPTKPGSIVGSIGPTTSSRMDKFIFDMPKLGVCGMIGKGPRSLQVRDACREYKMVYLVATGGAGALISKCVIKAEEVMFPELGCESIKRLEVKDFPLIVAYDIYGESVFKEK